MGKNVRLMKELALDRVSNQGVTWSRYLGLINHQKMHPIARRALHCFGNIKRRIMDPKHVDYKYYGAKGHGLDFDVRDLIGWYVAHYKSRPWKLPTVGRIDHNKGYSFDNIEMQEMSDNSKERITRKGNPGTNPSRPIYVLDSKLQPVAWFPNTHEAARFYGIGTNTPSESAKRKNWTTRSKRRFMFVDEFNL